MPSNLLKYVPAHTYEEPVFGLGFGWYLRFNYPKLPTEYTKVYGIQMSGGIPLGVTPRSSDTDIYIYLGFKVIEVDTNYSSIISTTYVDEQTSIVRLITDRTSTNSFYTNMFTPPQSNKSLYNSNDIIQVLMQKDGSDRFYYSSLTSSKSNYGTLLQETPSELKLLDTTYYISINLYGLFIRQNGTVFHNWVPCKRNSDNKPGFYNAVNGEFITNESMVVVNS